MSTPPVVEFGRPSQSSAGASTSTGPVLTTPAAPTPARVRPEDGANSQKPEEGAAHGKKDSSAPGSSAQGAAAKAPTSGSTPAQKDHPLDDF